MAKQDINIGAAPGDGTGDIVREAFRKSKENFNELYARPTGDMNKATYDPDNDGSVASADKIKGIDAAGNTTYYGKDSAGNKGFHALPAGTSYAPPAPYATVAALLADQGNQIEHEEYVVEDASGWSTITSGWATFQKKATSTASESDYVLREKGENPVEDKIVNGVTNKAPSQNAVFDALAGKSNTEDSFVYLGQLSYQTNLVDIIANETRSGYYRFRTWSGEPQTGFPADFVYESNTATYGTLYLTNKGGIKGVSVTDCAGNLWTKNRFGINEYWSKNSAEIVYGVEFVINSSDDGVTVPFTGNFATIDTDVFKTQSFNLEGSSALNWNLEDGTNFGSYVLKFTNKSTQVFTLTSTVLINDIWEKGVESNSITIATNESIEMVNDSSNWVVRNRY